MDRLLPLLIVLAFVVAGYRAATTLRRHFPSQRRWIIVASVAAIGLSALLVPWLLAKLDPPWSESPAGIFVYLGKALVVGGLGLSGLGALIGAVAPGRAGPEA